VTDVPMEGLKPHHLLHHGARTIYIKRTDHIIQSGLRVAIERDPDIGSLISVTRSCDLKLVGLKEASGSTIRI